VRQVVENLKFDEQSVKAHVQQALNEIAAHGGGVTVKLCPADAKLLTGLEEEVAERYKPLALVEDPELQPGDCLVESRFGIVDGRIETRLRKLGEELSA